MKQTYTLSVLFMCYIFVSCSSGEKGNSAAGNDELEIIKVDLSEAREGKLSEFFEPEIEYIWLKDDREEAQLSGALHKIIFSGDRIFVLDVDDCQCVTVFDKSGTYISEISAYGEGPGQYQEFDDFTIVGGEVLFLGIYPPKLMWFDREGKFLREEKLAKPVDTGLYVEKEDRLYFYHDTRDPGDYFVVSVNVAFRDTVNSLPFLEEGYYGNFSSRKLFHDTGMAIYFGKPFNDTIYQAVEGSLVPKLLFDYGEFGQNIVELKRNGESLNILEELDFFNNKSKLSFIPSQWFISESQLYSGFRYMGEFYNVFYNRESQATQVLKAKLSDDIDGAHDPSGMLYQFGPSHAGNHIAGKDLFKILEEKKAELGQEGFEEYVKGKGKNFAQAAFAAKDSENPVLIVYRVKK